MKQEKREYFPLFLSSKDKNVLVVGGGEIATRRIKTLLEFSFMITVVAPDVTQELEKIIENQEVIFYQREFEITDLQDKYMVVAATDSREINYKIGNACKEQNIFVTVADKKEECNFYFPAVVLEDQVIIALTSEGKSHKAVAEKAKELRRK